MKNQPKKIYLQIGEDTDPETDFAQLSEVTWSKDRVFENDLVYVAIGVERSLENLHQEAQIVARKLRQTAETKYSLSLALAYVIEHAGPEMVASIRAGNRDWWDSFLRDSSPKQIVGKQYFYISRNAEGDLDIFDIVWAYETSEEDFEMAKLFPDYTSARIELDNMIWQEKELRS